jgi:hypothetical protein
MNGPGRVLGSGAVLGNPGFTTNRIDGIWQRICLGLKLLIYFEEVIIHEMGRTRNWYFWRLADSGFDTPNLINLSTMGSRFFQSRLFRPYW